MLAKYLKDSKASNDNGTPNNKSKISPIGKKAEVELEQNMRTNGYKGGDIEGVSDHTGFNAQDRRGGDSNVAQPIQSATGSPFGLTPSGKDNHIPNGHDFDILPTLVALQEIENNENNKDTPGGPIGAHANQDLYRINSNSSGAQSVSSNFKIARPTTLDAQNVGLGVISQVTPMGGDEDGIIRDGDQIGDEGDNESESSDSMEAIARIRSQMQQRATQNYGANYGQGVDNVNHNDDDENMNENENEDEKQDMLDDDELGATPMGPK